MATRSKRPTVWKMQDAKAEFSRVVRLAREVGPQIVTYRGRDAVVVVDAATFAAQTGGVRRPKLSDVMRSMPKADVSFEHPRVPVRMRDTEF
jgi:antitoxin Phd